MPIIKSELNICQWNCRSAISNKENLENLLKETQTDIALLSETWFKPGVYVNFPMYDTLRTDRLDGKGGVAILIKNCIKYKENILPVFHDIPNKSITVLCNNLSITFVALYIKPNTRIDANVWTSFISSIPQPFLIGGDFNAHNQAWGCDWNDPHGVSLLEAVENNNVVYLNDGSPTLVGNMNTRASAIDITFVSPQITHLIEWRTYDDPSGSDHFPIIMKCKLIPQTYPRSNIIKWKIRKANWENYYDYSERVFNTNNSETFTYSDIIENINSTAETSIPRHSTKNTTSKGKNWWNEKCDEAVKKRKEAYRQYKQNPNYENLIMFKQKDAMVKKITKAAKRESWKKFCNSLNSSVPIKEVWSHFNRFRNRRQENYHTIDPEASWINDFHNKISPHWIPQNYSTNEDNHSMRKEDEFLTRPFSLKELDVAIKSSKNTAPGKDQIHYSMISNLAPNAKETILQEFNKIWRNRAPIPQDWQDYIVIPLLKQGKPPEDYKSYRPISLASCMLKTYERLIKNRLEYWLEKNEKLPSSQYGFRKGRSCQESLSVIISDIQLAFTRNMSISALFIDIEGAYDNINLYILTQKMLEIGIPQAIISNIFKLYSTRNLYIKTNGGLTSPRQSRVGLPQGSILSPLLYIIYTHELENVLPQNVKILQFADDICIYTENKKIAACNEELSNAMDTIKNWSNNMGFTISEQKSCICTFTRKRYQPPPQLRISTFTLKYNTCVRFLGIFLDMKLNWRKHISDICGRAENALNILRAVCGQRWGADPNIAVIFYRNMVRSILDYGSVFYHSASNNHLNKVDRIKNKGLKACGGYLKSTPTNVIEAEFREPPMSLRRSLLSDKLVLKLIAKSSILIPNLRKLAELYNQHSYWTHKKQPILVTSYIKLEQHINIIHQSTNIAKTISQYELFDNIPKIITNYFSPTTNIANIIEKEINLKWNNHEQIFTDGSCYQGNVGCAFYYKNGNVSKMFQLNKQASIYTAELTAIREAIRFCLTLNKTHFVIFTDSKSSLEKLKTSTIQSVRHHLLIDILALCLQMKIANKNITLVWIKGHIGITANEKVDALAKSACRSGETLHNFKIPHTDLLPYCKQGIKEIWQIQFQENTKGQFYKHLQPNIPNQVWFQGIQNKDLIRTICRMRSNHALYPEYQNKIGISNNPNCQCGALGSLQHVILECPMQVEHINRLYKELSQKKIPLPINISSLLSNNMSFSALHQYIIQSGTKI